MTESRIPNRYLFSGVLSYLVDTNVLSELRRRDPDAGATAWFSQRPATTLIRGLRLVTRNARDFVYPELEVINPWTD